MKLLLNTSTPVTKLVLVFNDDSNHEFEWKSGRELSKGLLSFIHESLQEFNLDFSDLTGLGFYKGPGSFTGLRIGVTVMNTLADSLEIPIVGVTGEDWVQQATELLSVGKNDKIVLPFYGAEAHVTKPRK